MSKSYYSLGLMSGTSMDGVDASIIQSDGKTKYKAILDKYFEYPKSIYNNLTKLRDKIKSSKDLKKYQKQIKFVEKEITIFHAKAVKQILKKTKTNIDFIGFHGQTIYHNAKERISKQLGDGKLLSEITKKTVVYDFRQNDLKNGGRGAPLTPIFHKLMAKKNKMPLPVIILNIGGIANATFIDAENNIFSRDIGPGNCLIDEWIRIKSKNGIKYDKNGSIAKSGKIKNKIIYKGLLEFEKIDNLPYDPTFDIKDFDISFVKTLSLKDGAATLAEYTSIILSRSLHFSAWGPLATVLITGGGRKNKFLISRIKKAKNDKIDKSLPFANLVKEMKSYQEKISIKLIDDYGVDGDFVESQAFAYLAIRSFLKLPISFPETTGVNKPCTGGTIIKY